MTYRRRRVEVIVGLFVLVALGVIAATVYAVRRARLPVEDRFVLRAELNNGFQLKSGAVVTLSGIEVGEVSEVALNERNRVSITLHVGRDVGGRLHPDASLTVSPLGMLGLPAVQLNPGQAQGELTEGAVLPAKEPGGLPEILAAAQPVIDDLTQLIGAVSALARRLDDEQGDFRGILRHLNSIARRIDEGEGTVGKAIAKADLHDDVLALVGQLNGLAGRVDGVLNELEGILGDVRGVSGQLPEMVGEVRYNLDELRRLLRGARGLPLLRDLVETPDPGRPFDADPAGD